MPKRQAIITYLSDDLQGEGSWVKLRVPKHGYMKTFTAKQQELANRSQVVNEKLKANDLDDDERRLLRKESQELFDQQVKAGEQLIIDHFYEWNWVDDDEQQLPSLKDNPELLEELNNKELAFINEKLIPQPNNSKK